MGLQRNVFYTLTAVILFGTAYSVVYDTYLDTSNPLLAHLPHPLSGSRYYANKSNFLNVYFIKRAWGWTSGAFLLSWITSPPEIRRPERLARWLIETAMWATFTSWFFGPAIIERVNLASGGACILNLPDGTHLTVPAEHCITRAPISPQSHPDIFMNAASLSSFTDWKGIPRIRNGHDVSGHIFLLTMSILFLTDQLRHSLRLRQLSVQHQLAVVANIVLIATWIFAAYTTSVYFHSPFEKFSGFCKCLCTLLPIHS
jgi:hypothetical protein